MPVAFQNRLLGMLLRSGERKATLLRVHGPWEDRAQVERELKGGSVQFTTLFKLDEDRSTETQPVWERTGELTRRRR